MRKLIKNILVFVGNALFAIARLFKSNNFTVKVLIYHDIPPELEDNFREHIQTLKKHFDFISPEQFYAYLNGSFKLKRSSLMVTFDDGFESSYDSTFNVLEPLGVKALFFICSGFIESGVTNNWRSYTSEYICDGNITESEVEEWQKPMTWKQILQLDGMGHMIGGHTKNHTRLSKVKDLNIIISEVFDDKTTLENKLGKTINSIAYPYGDINSISSEALKIIESIYEYCYSGVRGRNHIDDKQSILKRDVTGFYLKTPEVKFIANGGYDWYYSNDRKQLENMVS